MRRAFWVIFVGQSLYLFEVRHKILQRIFSKEYVFLASLRHVLVATKEVKRGRNLEVSNFTTFSLHHFSTSCSNTKFSPYTPSHPRFYFLFMFPGPYSVPKHLFPPLYPSPSSNKHNQTHPPNTLPPLLPRTGLCQNVVVLRKVFGMSGIVHVWWSSMMCFSGSRCLGS